MGGGNRRGQTQRKTLALPVRAADVNQAGSSELQAGETRRCFGRYRAQSPQYALAECVKCPRLKDCVRTAWGMEQPKRVARREYSWEMSPRGRAAVATPQPLGPTRYDLAT